MSDPKSEVKPDQDLINQRILSLLKAIGKCLSVIENSASAARPNSAIHYLWQFYHQ